MYVEQYVRWGLCFLVGGCILFYIIMLGLLLGSHPQFDWPDLVIANIKDLVITDYAHLAANTPKLVMFSPISEIAGLKNVFKVDENQDVSEEAAQLVEEILEHDFTDEML